ncbi:MAG TPA: hypothetical protein VF800_13030 [Telluria sp.]
MRKFICAVAYLATASAIAQPPPTMPGPVGKERMQLLSLDRMPLPLPKTELLKMQSATVTTSDDGFSAVSNSPERVRQFVNDLEIVKGLPSTAQQAEAFAQTLMRGPGVPTAPMVVRSLNDLKIGFGPAGVRSGKLIGVVPQGTIVGGGWTGIERYFQIDGAGYWRLSENDMSLTGGMFYMNKAAVNTTVGGKPAIAKVFTDDHGKRIEEVVWVDGSKFYMLTYAPDLQPGRFSAMKTNAGVSASALASEVR